MYFAAHANQCHFPGRRRGYVAISIFVTISAICMLLMANMVDAISTRTTMDAWDARRQRSVEKTIIAQVARDVTLEYLAYRKTGYASAPAASTVMQEFATRMSALAGPCNVVGFPYQPQLSADLLKKQVTFTVNNVTGITAPQEVGAFGPINWANYATAGLDGRALLFVQNQAGVYEVPKNWVFSVNRNDTNNPRAYTATAHAFYTSPFAFNFVAYSRPSVDTNPPSTAAIPVTMGAGAMAMCDTACVPSLEQAGTILDHHVASGENLVDYDHRTRIDAAWAYFDGLFNDSGQFLAPVGTAAQSTTSLRALQGVTGGSDGGTQTVTEPNPAYEPAIQAATAEMMRQAQANVWSSARLDNIGITSYPSVSKAGEIRGNYTWLVGAQAGKSTYFSIGIRVSGGKVVVQYTAYWPFAYPTPSAPLPAETVTTTNTGPAEDFRIDTDLLPPGAIDFTIPAGRAVVIAPSGFAGKTQPSLLILRGGSTSTVKFSTIGVSGSANIIAIDGPFINAFGCENHLFKGVLIASPKTTLGSGGIGIKGSYACHAESAQRPSGFIPTVGTWDKAQLTSITQSTLMPLQAVVTVNVTDR